LRNGIKVTAAMMAEMLQDRREHKTKTVQIGEW
jgi:hypothetical protein